MQVVTDVVYDRRQRIGIGQGQNSTVYRASDAQFGGTIAVKEMPKSRFPDAGAYFQEAQAVHASRCDNVVPIHWAGQTATSVCVATPYYPDGTLSDRIQHGPMRLSDVVRLCQDVCAGVGHIHMAGLAHLDLKPTNILFDGGQAKVTDFGQAVRSGPTGVITGSVCMYNNYWPPEAIAYSALTQVSDIYQLGITLYRAINGEPFYAAQLAALAPGQIEGAIQAGKFPNRQYLAHVPQKLRGVVNRAMHVDPGRRYQSPDELAVALGAVNMPHDWEVVVGADVTTWQLTRPGRPSIEVVQAARGASFEVAVWSVGRVRRRLRPADFGGQNLSSREADKALRTVFKSLP